MVFPVYKCQVGFVCGRLSYWHICLLHISLVGWLLMCIVIFSQFLSVVTRERKSRATVTNWPMKPPVMSTCMCLENIITCELLTLTDPDYSGVRVTQSLVLCVCFADRCLSFCPFYFGHCVVWFRLILRIFKPFLWVQVYNSDVRSDVRSQRL